MTTSTNGLEKPGARVGEPNRALMDCAPTGVIAVDGSSRVSSINTYARNVLKLNTAPVVGEPASRLPSPISQWIDDALARLEPNESTFSVRNAKFSAQITTSRGADGQIIGVLVEFQDTSGAQNISDNLEHLDQLAALGAVTAGVAHEIKNALVAVRTFFDLGALGEDDPELREVAASEIGRIEKTVRQLLRGAKRERFRMEPLSVHAVVQDAVNLLRHELQTRAIQLTTTFNAAIDRVNGDERQLRHALVNLLLNAIEAMGSAGHLTITSEVVEAWERQHLQLNIHDTGPGIPADALDKLFTPFFTTKPEGTGLGLSISQRILQAHNGAITVESRDGEGTSFRMFLPLL